MITLHANMNPSQIILHSGVVGHSKENISFTIVVTDVNHGVLQQTVITEIINNALDNPTH